MEVSTGSGAEEEKEERECGGGRKERADPSRPRQQTRVVSEWNLCAHLPTAARQQFEEAHSCEVVNTRQALLHFCQTQALQFNSLRYAQFSTMRIIQEIVSPAPKADDGGPAYCLAGCLRGRADDGSMMIACDVCDNWFHPGCLASLLGGMPEGEDDSFACPLCVESKADAYLDGLGLGICQRGSWRGRRRRDDFTQLL